MCLSLSIAPYAFHAMQTRRTLKSVIYTKAIGFVSAGTHTSSSDLRACFNPHLHACDVHWLASSYLLMSMGLLVGID